MIRNEDINEISDGRFYTANDPAPLGCNECEGCSACCREMGDSVILDPLDICRLTNGLGKNFQELLESELDIHEIDIIALPHLNMDGKTGACGFLNEAGRCTIHPFRPGICRLFPLGRYYENGSFRYILQANECQKENRTDVKIADWLDTPDLKKYEFFTNSWHNFIRKVGKVSPRLTEESRNRMYMQILTVFYNDPYSKETDFYVQYVERMRRIMNSPLGKIL